MKEDKIFIISFQIFLTEIKINSHEKVGTNLFIRTDPDSRPSDWTSIFHGPSFFDKK